MEIIKFIILTFIFLIFLLIGRQVSKKFLYRLKELIEIKEIINNMKTRIRFTYSPIKEIFDDIEKGAISIGIQEVFRNASQNIEQLSAEESWYKAVKASENTYLTSQDKDFFCSLGKSLGRTDIEGQVSQFDITEELIQKQIEDARDKKDKNEKLYNQLGAIVGLAVVIVLI